MGAAKGEVGAARWCKGTPWLVQIHILTLVALSCFTPFSLLNFLQMHECMNVISMYMKIVCPTEMYVQGLGLHCQIKNNMNYCSWCN